MFEAPIFYDEAPSARDVRNPEWYQKVSPPLTREEILAFARYVIRTNGVVDVGNNACAMCLTRVLPNGAMVKGAQGNYPFHRALSWAGREASVDDVRTMFRIAAAAPWLGPRDPVAGIEERPKTMLHAMMESAPSGVLTRHHASFESPTGVPDLIGLKSRAATSTAPDDPATRASGT